MKKGFTLVELLVVLAILGIMAAVVIPNVYRIMSIRTAEYDPDLPPVTVTANTTITTTITTSTTTPKPPRTITVTPTTTVYITQESE